MRDTIEASPTTSMRKQAKNLGVSKDTIRNAVQDLGLVSYVRRRRQLLSDASKETRVMKGKKLLTWMKHNGSTVRIFSDKKLWTVDQHPASAMMLGDASILVSQGAEDGAKEYLEVMQNVVKPWLDATYPEGNYVFQQDSAPGHKAKITQKWIEENLAAFWPGSMWPPSSSDCNPLDYGIWVVVERKACSIPHASVDALKAAVEKEWAEMSVDFIVKTCKAFRPGSRPC
ncbi:Transposable element tcb2 transposase [Caligus rogercresseyi]|uniref:Transposable element tcb2 transposase n=1 Tax=Caligus rogercresseyi TaxID=217165 RepID=A0A7T8HFG2_CALRO|nr:Transposable element tcb2 transposase [Caligus rogercresseyi]